MTPSKLTNILLGSANICTSQSTRMPFFIVLLAVPSLYYVFRYKKAIQKRIEEIERSSSKVEIYREKNYTENQQQRKVRCLELHPDFVEKYKDQWQLMSLGQYLSSLRRGEGTVEAEAEAFFKKELEITIGKLLLKFLGKMYGAALLPAIGNVSVDSFLEKKASQMSGFIAKRVLSDDCDNTAVQEELGTFPLTLSEVASILNVNQTLGGKSNMTDTPLEFLCKGELDIFEHSFDGLIPNPFMLETDFEKTIAQMEDRVRKSDNNDVKYDPNDKSLPDPTPINSQILPDLHMGLGGTCNTHTKRETLINRLTALLLNKLSYNYYKQVKNEKDLFRVEYNGEICQYPNEFIQALINTGHKVDVCPRTQISNFGLYLSVKEDDGSWTMIPTTMMLRTGFERYSDSKAVSFAAPHGGIDYYITGPLIGTTNTCALQYYIAIDGLCAFHSDQDVIAPWKNKASLTVPYTTKQAVRTARMAGLVSVAVSIIGTELSLPCGGYGVLGMCNDISGIIDHAIHGKTSAYPLSSTGRYLGHLIRCLMRIQSQLKDKVGMEFTVDDIQKLIHSVTNIDNDLHTSPSNARSTIKRYKRAYPELSFQLTANSIEMLNEISEECEALGTWAKVSRYL